MSKTRVTRKQLLKEPDEFITQTGKVIRWGRAYRKPLIAGTVVVLVAVAAVTAWRYMSERAEKQAFARLGATVIEYRQAAASKGPEEAFKNVQASLQSLVDQTGSTSMAGRLATLTLANWAYAAGDNDRSLALYERLEGAFADQPTLQRLVTSGQAYCCEQKGLDEKALALFQQIASRDNGALRDDAIFHLGLLHEKMGAHEQSQAAFERIATDFEESVFSNLAREKGTG